MVTALVPIAVFAGVSATVFFAFFSFWGSVNERANARVRGIADRLDRAGIRSGSQEIVLTVLSGAAILWIGLLLVLHPPLLVSLILLPAILLGAGMAFFSYVNVAVGRRLNAFCSQLEPATRLLAGGLRVGLGLRQALAMVIEELPDPARYEFRRVIGQTNLGASVYDAFDDLSERMPSHEGLMLARVFRVQAETGGDLARILDQLGETIKHRRQVQRKCDALTAEGRMSAWVLMLIPLCLGAFIVATQESMGHALLYTTIGHGVMLIVAILEVCAYLCLKALLRIDA
ncbi:MAG: type II secretion system F family protein [Candidatus Cybelea sp.]